MKKNNIKKYLNTTNILMLLLVIIYLLDCYLPLPKGYSGYTNWADDSSATINYIFGFCGGRLTNLFGLGTAFSGDFYRHFTQIFLHGGLLHLIANLIGLYFIGNYTEKRFGWWLTLIIFIVVGFAESYITDPLYIAIVPSAKLSEVSVGASAAIFGLMGASLAAIFFDFKSYKEISKTTLIVSAIYGFSVTYLISFGWTTLCHNIGLILGLAVGTIIILPFFLLKKGKFAKTSPPPKTNEK